MSFVCAPNLKGEDIYLYRLVPCLLEEVRARLMEYIDRLNELRVPPCPGTVPLRPIARRAFALSGWRPERASLGLAHVAQRLFKPR